MDSTHLLVIITVVVALCFDFINGFHDAANSIATVVSTRVLSPRLAVLWAAFFNFAAAFFLGTAVAKTIGKGMIDITFINQYVVLAGLLGAIVWDLMTWWWGLPTSSSHALIGGYAGAAVAKALSLHVIIPQGWTKTLLFIVLSPLIGLVLGFVLMVAMYWLVRRRSPRQVDTWFRILQLFSSAGVSFAHGGSDAQKTMGIVAGALYTGHIITRAEMEGNWGRFHWPIIIGAYVAIALGTYAGGWRIVHTMGSKITKLRPIGGFCAESAAAITLVGTALYGIPVSTTHTITGAIVGVGATQRLSAVRWGIARRIIWAWVLTIPAAAAVAAALFYIMKFIAHAA